MLATPHVHKIVVFSNLQGRKFENEAHLSIGHHHQNGPKSYSTVLSQCNGFGSHIEVLSWLTESQLVTPYVYKIVVFSNLQGRKFENEAHLSIGHHHQNGPKSYSTVLSQCNGFGSHIVVLSWVTESQQPEHCTVLRCSLSILNVFQCKEFSGSFLN